MRHEPVQSLRDAIELGPDHVPNGLFAGSQAAIFRGLRAYANTISHARYVAMEETFPKTRIHMGAEAFHLAASRHLHDAAAVQRPLRLIGEGFAALLAPAAADMADAEWAYLEAHGAEDAPAILLSALADETPERLVAARVALHPATRLLGLRRPAIFAWDGLSEGDATYLLVTRPEQEVLFARVGIDEARLIGLARRTITLGELLEEDAAATTTLITVGALRPVLETI